MTLGYEMRLPFDTRLPLSEQAVLEVNPFLARKMPLLNDTLQLAYQHLREQPGFTIRTLLGPPSNQATRCGCKIPRRRPDNHASSADPGQDPLQ